MKQVRKLLYIKNNGYYLFKRLAFSLFSLWFWWVVANLLNVVIRELSFLTMPMFGILQWLVLRKYIPRLGWWILASAYDWIATYLIIYILEVGQKIVEVAPRRELVIIGVSVNMQVLWFYISIMVLASTVIGIFQWLVLRTRIRYAFWWIFASLMGGVAKGSAIALVPPTLDPILIEFIGSLAYGAITGIALVALLQTLA